MPCGYALKEYCRLGKTGNSPGVKVKGSFFLDKSVSCKKKESD